MIKSPNPVGTTQVLDQHHELYVFLNAIMFFTRIPVPKNLPYTDDMQHRSMRYLPFIGWIVGSIGAAVFYGLHFVFTPGLSILLSMVATIFVTGAFHEDGFADFCDAFGGGYTRERILAIMKDSRLGTYGSIGLLGILATKFLGLSSIEAASIPLALVTGHAISRLMPILIINTAHYSRDDASSKSKPIGKKGRGADFLLALCFATILLALHPLQFVLVILPVLLATTYLFRRYLINRIGGYTGDCLGAIQQIAEVEFYLGFVVFQNLQL